MKPDLEVVCPLCHADPGDQCINYGQAGRPRFVGLVHTERRDARIDAERDALRTYLGGPDGV